MIYYYFFMNERKFVSIIRFSTKTHVNSDEQLLNGAVNLTEKKEKKSKKPP